MELGEGLVHGDCKVRERRTIIVGPHSSNHFSPKPQPPYLLLMAILMCIKKKQVIPLFKMYYFTNNLILNFH